MSESNNSFEQEKQKKEPKGKVLRESLRSIPGKVFKSWSKFSFSRFGKIVALIVIIKCIYLFGCLVNIQPGHVGIVFSKLGKEPEIKDRFIVEKGQKGYWREVLLPGWHFFFLAERLWKYDIDEEPMTPIPAQQVGIVEALDGKPLPEGEILAQDDYVDEKGVFHMGQKGPRRTVLKPGLHPINTRYLKVQNVPAVVIPEGKIGVVIRRVGEEPPPGTILVSKEGNYRGIQREVLPPGTYYFNPLAVKVEQVGAIIIKKGQVGIVAKKVGKMPPPGTILVSAEDEYRGIQQEVLQPGMYYVNPYENEVKIVDAVIVPDGYVGVQIAKTGRPKPMDKLLADLGERGILEETLSPGMYYINPYEYDVVIFDTREQRYEMTQIPDAGDTKGADAIHFLSDDGFSITFDLTVIFRVNPEDAPYVVATVGRDVNAVREIRIRPSTRSFARIIGSMSKGEEFIHGETREKFQSNLYEALKRKCAETRIQIIQALVRNFEVPVELRDPIVKKVIAMKLESQYKQQQETEKASAELARQRELVIFEAEKVKAGTMKAKAVIKAEEQRDVEETLKEMKRFEAEGDAVRERIRAEARLYAAQKEAEGILAKKMAEAKGQKEMVNAWSGQGAQFLVASDLARIMQGAAVIPLETIFGGGPMSSGQEAPIRYHNTVDLLNFFKLDELLLRKDRDTLKESSKEDVKMPVDITDIGNR